MDRTSSQARPHHRLFSIPTCSAQLSMLRTEAPLTGAGDGGPGLINRSQAGRGNGASSISRENRMAGPMISHLNRRYQFPSPALSCSNAPPPTTHLRLHLHPSSTSQPSHWDSYYVLCSSCPGHRPRGGREGVSSPLPPSPSPSSLGPGLSAVVPEHGL